MFCGVDLAPSKSGTRYPESIREYFDSRVNKIVFSCTSTDEIRTTLHNIYEPGNTCYVHIANRNRSP
jgi:hypothetical protein